MVTDSMIQGLSQVFKQGALIALSNNQDIKSISNLLLAAIVCLHIPFGPLP